MRHWNCKLKISCPSSCFVLVLLYRAVLLPYSATTTSLDVLCDGSSLMLQVWTGPLVRFILEFIH